MKKNYILTSLLFVLFLLYLNTSSQIRYTKVDPVNNTLTIHNYGSSSVNISGYFICHLLSYQQLSTLTIDSGNLMLGAGNDLMISGFTLNSTASDLGLYINNNNFADPNTMIDFLQWGSSGNGRESVAVSKGIWGTGDFINTQGPYFYNGNGTQTGISFWSNATLAVTDFTFSKQVSVYPNPVDNILNIKNGSDEVVSQAEIFDILGKRIYTNAGNKINNALNLSNLSSGIYYLRLTSNKGTISSKKIVKN